jgi:hypothetical protein
MWLPCKRNNYYIFWVYVCSLCYPAYKAHAPCFIVIFGLSDSTIFFPLYLISGTIFWRKVTERKMRALIFSINLSETFFIITRIERDMIKLCIGFDLKYLLFLSDFIESRIFTTDLWQAFKYQISWKSVKGEPSCSMWTGKRKERHRGRQTEGVIDRKKFATNVP